MFGNDWATNDDDRLQWYKKLLFEIPGDEENQEVEEICDCLDQETYE